MPSPPQPSLLFSFSNRNGRAADKRATLCWLLQAEMKAFLLDSARSRLGLPLPARAWRRPATPNHALAVPWVHLEPNSNKAPCRFTCSLGLPATGSWSICCTLYCWLTSVDEQGGHRVPDRPRLQCSCNMESRLEMHFFLSATRYPKVVHGEKLSTGPRSRRGNSLCRLW